MKVIRKSNFDYDDWRGNQWIVAQRLWSADAIAVANLLNERAGERSEDFFVAVEDDYVLPPDWEP